MRTFPTLTVAGKANVSSIGGLNAAGVDVVVLSGAIGDNATWTGGLPRPLLPLPGTTVLESLLRKLGDTFSGTCTICTNGHLDEISRLLAHRQTPASRVKLVEDPVPRGSAGCLKLCTAKAPCDTVLIASGSLWLEEDPAWLVERHRACGNDLTVFCKRDVAATPHSRPARLRPVGLYCCNTDVLELVPDRGYQDLKEQLIPILQKAGRRVGAIPLRGHSWSIIDWPTYLRTIERVLTTQDPDGGEFREIAPTVWCGRDVEVAPKARIVGPAFIGRGTRIQDGSVVIGPALIGRGTEVGAGSWLVRVVTPEWSRIPRGAVFTDRVLPAEAAQSGMIPAGPAPAPSIAPAPGRPLDSFSTADARPSALTRPPISLVKGVAIGCVLAGLLVWSFWHTFVDLWHVWQNSADYSAGQLVPLAFAYMVATRRSRLKDLSVTFAPTGVVVFLGGLLLNLAGNYYLFSSLENLGLVVCANGIAMSLLGWNGYRRFWYPLTFLFLMIPLPNRIHDAVMLPLQNVGARISGGLLEIIGVPAERYGHVLEVAGQKVAVADACNGLRMAVAFLIVAAFVAYIIRRPRWQKLVVLVSSVPIALACNVLRITGTAYLYHRGFEEVAQGTLHDLAGLLMMPLALALILMELRMLSSLARSASSPGRSLARSTGGFATIATSGSHL